MKQYCHNTFKTLSKFLLYYINRYVSVLLFRNAVDTGNFVLEFCGGGSIQRKKVDAFSIIYIGGKGVY